MATSISHRARVDVLAAWLNDRFGHTVVPNEPGQPVPDAAFNRDSQDLIKFLTAHGFHIQVPEKPVHAPWCEWVDDGWYDRDCDGCIELAKREDALKGPGDHELEAVDAER